MSIFRFALIPALATLAALSSASFFHVSQNVAALKAGGTYYAYFNLTDGGSTLKSSSSVTVKNLSLTGGALDPSPITDGSYAGVSGGFKITDTGGYGLAAFGFTVSASASTLSFDFETQESLAFSSSPDYFLYSILDSGFNPVTTNGPLGQELVGASLNPTGTVLNTYAPIHDGSPLSNLSAPALQPSAVPEPAAWASFGVGAVALLRRRSRR